MCLAPVAWPFSFCLRAVCRLDRRRGEFFSFVFSLIHSLSFSVSPSLCDASFLYPPFHQAPYCTHVSAHNFSIFCLVSHFVRFTLFIVPVFIKPGPLDHTHILMDSTSVFQSYNVIGNGFCE